MKASLLGSLMKSKVMERTQFPASMLKILILKHFCFSQSALYKNYKTLAGMFTFDIHAVWVYPLYEAGGLFHIYIIYPKSNVHNAIIS